MVTWVYKGGSYLGDETAPFEPRFLEIEHSRTIIFTWSYFFHPGWVGSQRGITRLYGKIMFTF